MDNIIVITQNIKLPSLIKLREYIKQGSKTLIVSTQFIFENEASEIESYLNSKCKFVNFSDVLCDAELEACDVAAFNPTEQKYVFEYYEKIKRIKNRRIAEKITANYPCVNKIIVSDDLGLSLDEWIKCGFQYISCEYYHQIEAINVKNNNVFISQLRSIYHFLGHLVRSLFGQKIYKASYDGKRYLFYGSLNRIAYRIDLDFHPASFVENMKLVLFNWGIVWNDNVVRLSTLHECYGVLPDNKKLNIKLIQDGYLPGNYSSKYLKFYGNNVEYYAWDALGKMIFKYHDLPHRIMPFRKKLFLPIPNFPSKIKKVLCVASGAGDWTALKNRSDEDKMIYVFGKIAAVFPGIEFVYRCHPVWIHPQHQGVNSILRAGTYIEWLNLPNLKVSCNIPNANEKGKFILSYKRSSFEDDLKGVDIVFGEHSISMIDAAFKNILFASCNVTGRRDLFVGVSDLGFPHCESLEDIVSLLRSLTTSEFKVEYTKAIMNYNEMTNIE